MIKVAVVAAVVVLLLAIFALDLTDILTLDAMKANLAQFERWRSASPLLVTLTFFVLYVALATLSIPGAAVMTIAAGGLFGLLMGTLIVSFASAIGATLAFLVSRHLLREPIQNRFGKRLKTINQGMARDGVFYLFTLRMVPLFPYFLVNLLMGLTPIRTSSYYLVSQVGMLAATLVYVNAGTQLARINSLADIASPGLLLSFTLLGIFPLLAKWFLGVLRRKRQKKNSEQYK